MAMINKDGDRQIIINILVNSTYGKMSGGDRIWIECARRWKEKQGITINVLTTEEGMDLGYYYKLDGVKYVLWAHSRFRKLGVYMLYVGRTVMGCISAIRYHKPHEYVIILSSSDFLPDSIPALIMKRQMPDSLWVGSFYLFAPNPLSPDSPYKGKRFIRGIVYYFSQIPIYWLLRKFADMVWVTSEPDRWRFIDNERLTPNKVIAVRGGVDVKAPLLIPEPERKIYDAVFLGRFHPQKGILELVDIWRYVCERKRDARLAIIGVGELENELISKIKNYGLENNIVLFGFQDGDKKLKIFKDSKVVVHPATYDSGGMAACEAMSCGLPGVSFDLPALRTYYPKGMIKTHCYDMKEFAENILRLLNDEELYRRIAKDALDWAREWDWDKRADELLSYVLKLVV